MWVVAGSWDRTVTANSTWPEPWRGGHPDPGPDPLRPWCVPTAASGDPDTGPTSGSCEMIALVDDCDSAGQPFSGDPQNDGAERIASGAGGCSTGADGDADRAVCVRGASRP